MGKSKTSEFSEASNCLADYFKAMAHPARVEIIQFLLKAESCVCGDIVAVLPLSQSTVSQHLKALKDIGLVKGTISGPNVCYCIDEANWKNMQQVVSHFSNQNPPTLSCQSDKNCC